MGPAKAALERALRDPDNELRVASTLVLLWRMAGREPKYPASTAMVVHLLADVGEYAIDLAWLENHIKRGGMIAPPIGRNGDRKWPAAYIGHLRTQLELMRRWKPDSELHLEKKTRWELGQEMAETCGEQSVFSDLAFASVESLLASLLHEGDVHMRIAIFVAIKAKLGRLIDEL